MRWEKGHPCVYQKTLDNPLNSSVVIYSIPDTEHVFPTASIFLSFGNRAHAVCGAPYHVYNKPNLYFPTVVVFSTHRSTFTLIYFYADIMLLLFIDST